MNESPKIRIIVVDDHEILREGIRYLCLSASDITLVGEAASGEEALTIYYELQPDVVLLDLVMEGMDGIDIIRAMLEQCPEAKILVLTSFNTENLIHQAMEVGAKGYILKTASTEDILNTIRLTYKNMTILSPEVSDHLQRSPSETILTPRQLEVLKLIVRGLNNTQIGQVLNISTYTARFHVSEILAKFGVSTRTAVVSTALRQKIINCQDL